MNYTTLSSWGPEKTPALIKQLIVITSVICVLSAGAQTIFEQFGLFPGPQNFLSLSWWGMANGFIWQPLTFLFIQESGGGLSFFFFLTLLFNMYLLWVIGSAIYQMLGKRAFLSLYFIGGITAGLITLFSMKLTGQHTMLVGLTPALLVLFTVWSMAFPETEILLLFIFPVKVKWLTLSLVGILLLISLTHLDFSNLILYLTAVIIGYAYAVMVQGWYSPFPATLKFDMWLARIASKFRQIMPSLRRKEKDVKTPEVKIVDIKTADPRSPLDDDSFVDAMLTKISKRGEDSLSWSEKKRLKEISEKKMRDGR